MSNINSSALSDDGKFSTRALRGFGTSDLEYNNTEQQIRERRQEGDGAGLSTHVEHSDKGSRRAFHHHNEERIDEVEEEGSGRTSPPGTIGEAHEYMSEHIQSQVIDKVRKQKGNQSVIGSKDPLANKNVENFDNNESDVTGCSNFAVIREKI
jgi:hypothetical protein